MKTGYADTFELYAFAKNIEYIKVGDKVAPQNKISWRIEYMSSGFRAALYELRSRPTYAGHAKKNINGKSILYMS
jgi:hypothetical protein